MKWIFATAAIASFGAGCEKTEPAALALTTGSTAPVRSVLKSDEIVLGTAESTAPVRLLGVHGFSAVIDDEGLDALSSRGKTWLIERLGGKTVEVTLGTVPQDRYGRYLAFVEEAGQDVNEQLIAEGVTLVYTEYPFEREAAYLEVEAQARSGKRGLWGEPKAHKWIRGLRQQWAENRKDRGFEDPLLPSDENVGGAGDGEAIAPGGGEAASKR